MNMRRFAHHFAHYINTSALLGMVISAVPSAELFAKKRHDKYKDCEVFDFVIVGAGNTGCVIANRLSESGKYTVCLLEGGRDDGKLPELLPQASPANVPQPGDYHWGKLTRGVANIANILDNRGFGSWHFFQEATDGTRHSTTNHRYSGFGGCTVHNVGVAIRNSPYNWDQWVALGLTDWDASKPTSNLVRFYKKVENRSQTIGGTPARTQPLPQAPGTPYYDPALKGEIGGWDADWYGWDGYVPLRFAKNITAPTATSFQGVTQSIVGTTLNEELGFSYPTQAPGIAQFVDLDYPPTTAQGGVSIFNVTQTDQIGNIIVPNTTQDVGKFTDSVPFATYNFPLYGDDGFRVPEEFQDLNNPTLNPTVLQPTQRVHAANAYLYPAENRHNLTIKSEVLVTNLIMKGKKAKGVEYLQGWNIYQAARHPDTAMAGYGGTRGDAQFNGVAAKASGKKRVIARKAVILSAGVYNTPQILMLSGIGDKTELAKFDIASVTHLPGVGKHLIDNTELFVFWQVPAATTTPLVATTLAAFSNPGDAFPTFEIVVPSVATQALEIKDPFVEKGWVGVRNIPSVNASNVRNTFHNILLDATNQNSNPPVMSISLANPPLAPANNTLPWSVTFTVALPEGYTGAPPAGGYTVSGNSNPSYNGEFTSTAIGSPNQGTVTITLAFPSNPGAFGTGTTTILANPAFLPVMVTPGKVAGMLVEQEENCFSEGFVTLQSADPTVPLRIVMDYLNDPRDLQAWKDVMMKTVFPMLVAYKNAPSLVPGAQSFFANLLYPAPADILVPGLTNFTGTTFNPLDVDQARLEAFLKKAVGGHHAGGTCKMGVASDPLAVVDQHGKVLGGIKNLYIADNSILPVSIRWPNGTLYVVGEKIAADILATHGT